VTDQPSATAGGASPFESSDEFVAQSFKRLNWRGKTASDKKFERCTFSHCTFAESTFDGCIFRDCSFIDCACRLIHVPKSRFVNVKFDKCDLTYVNWTEGVWPKAAGSNALTFTATNVSHSTFTGLALKKLIMTGCTAHNVDFAQTDLLQAKCVETDFTDSRFHNTNLTEADFSRAVGYVISPVTNKVRGAKFSLPDVLSLLAAFEIVVNDYPTSNLDSQ